MPDRVHPSPTIALLLAACGAPAPAMPAPSANALMPGARSLAMPAIRDTTRQFRMLAHRVTDTTDPATVATYTLAPTSREIIGYHVLQRKSKTQLWWAPAKPVSSLPPSA